MFTVIFLLIHLVFTVLGHLRSDASSARIVGGHPVDISERPFQALVSIYKNDEQISHCGGILLTKDKVLTAAHCLLEKPLYIDVKLGSTRFNGNGQIYFATQYVNHPKYSVFTGDYDVSIITLHEPVRYGTNVKKIRLIEKEPVAGEKGTISGWGHTEELPVQVLDGARRVSEYLETVEVDIIDRDECWEKLCSYRAYNVTDRMICAGVPEGGKDFCEGDSGGPLTVGGRLAGIVSWNIGCGDDRYPGVYTNIANREIRNFIVTYTL